MMSASQTIPSLFGPNSTRALMLHFSFVFPYRKVLPISEAQTSNPVASASKKPILTASMPATPE